MVAVVAAVARPDSAAARPQARQAATTQQQIQLVKKHLWKSKTTINFWNNRGRWALHLRHDKCWQIKLGKRQRVCKMARRSLADHIQRRAKLADKLERLSAPRFNLGNVSHWLCIHRGEGAWNSNTGNGYYGGLQMNWSFMSAYGPKILGYASAAAMFAARGTADRWTPQEQMAVAEYARSSGRGYYPWPNTARACGLI